MAKKTSKNRSTSKAAISLAYIGIWIGLGSLGMMYLIQLVTAVPETKLTELAKQTRSEFKNMDSDSKKAIRIAERATKSTWPLHNDIATIKRDMLTLDSRISNIEKADSNHAQRIQNLENEFKLTTSAVPKPDGKPVTPAKNRNQDNKNILEKLLSENTIKTPRSPIKIKYLPLPEDGFGDTAPEQINLDSESKSNSKSPKQISKTMFGIHLGTASTISEVKRNWERIKLQNEKKLDGLKAKYFEIGSVNGFAYQLIAGPFNNVLDAVQICAAMRSAKHFCEQTVYDGKPL